jgi:cytochrome P450
MTADAFTFHGAGTDTTAHTLTTATWHLINNKECLQKLRKEVNEAITDPENEQLVSSNVLENLPYLVSMHLPNVEKMLLTTSYRGPSLRRP